jgi:hypothetical protein
MWSQWSTLGLATEETIGVAGHANDRGVDLGDTVRAEMMSGATHLQEDGVSEGN